MAALSAARLATCVVACLLAGQPLARAAQGSAATAASLLPQGQQILAQVMAPPSPGSVQAGAKVCDKGDATCYDHTGNLGLGNLTVGRTFPAKARGPYNYAEALHKSYIFYDAQRSGKLPFQAGGPFVFSTCCTCSLSRNHVSVCTADHAARSSGLA